MGKGTLISILARIVDGAEGWMPNDIECGDRESAAQRIAEEILRCAVVSYSQSETLQSGEASDIGVLVFSTAFPPQEQDVIEVFSEPDRSVYAGYSIRFTKR